MFLQPLPGTAASDKEFIYAEQDKTRGEDWLVFKPAPLGVIKDELEEAGELGPLAIKSIIEGLRVSSVYKGKSTPTE